MKLATISEIIRSQVGHSFLSHLSESTSLLEGFNVDGGNHEAAVEFAQLQTALDGIADEFEDQFNEAIEFALNRIEGDIDGKLMVVEPEQPEAKVISMTSEPAVQTKTFNLKVTVGHPNDTTLDLEGIKQHLDTLIFDMLFKRYGDRLTEMLWNNIAGLHDKHEAGTDFYINIDVEKGE
jgi:hypothetical protein